MSKLSERRYLLILSSRILGFVWLGLTDLGVFLTAPNFSHILGAVLAVKRFVKYSYT